MGKFPSQQEVVAAVLEGIEEAKKNYLFWTNGRLFLSYGPGKIITLHIAQALGKLPLAPEVFIDATVADILRCTLPDRLGYIAYMKENDLRQGVFDITLDERFAHQNDNDSVSKVVISVKNGVRNSKLEYAKEIERICKMLHPSKARGGTLEYGMFAFYGDLDEGARKKLAKRVAQMVEDFDAIVALFPSLEGHFYSSQIKRVPDVGEWCAGCYVVRPTY